MKLLETLKVIKMDIKCANCGEPWDNFHLKHDEVHETEAGIEMIYDKLNQEKWEKESKLYRDRFPFESNYTGEKWEGKLTPFWREQFAKSGWKFGLSVFTVLECCACKDNGQLEETYTDLYKEADELLAGDEDGLVVTLSDMDHYLKHWYT